MAHNKPIFNHLHSVSDKYSLPLTFQLSTSQLQRSLQDLKLTCPMSAIITQACVSDGGIIKHHWPLPPCFNVHERQESHFRSFRSTGAPFLHCPFLMQAHRIHKQLSHACRVQEKVKGKKRCYASGDDGGTSGCVAVCLSQSGLLHAPFLNSLLQQKLKAPSKSNC